MTLEVAPRSGVSSPHPSPGSLRGLDWFVFFLANAQTGFGPFIAVYLTSRQWTQVDIGLVLTVAGLFSLLGQIPGGALVDAARSERFVGMLGVIGISFSALMIGVWPSFPSVLAAEILHSLASCVVGPVVAAISLGLVGHAAIGERLGRNACFASLGNGLAAAGMGAAGYFLSSQSVFYLAALLGIPTLLALLRVRAFEVDPVRAHGGVPRTPRPSAATFRWLAHNRALIVFAACVVLFHLANAAMLPLMGSVLTMRSSTWATVLIAACIVVPQLVVAALSPWVGRQAQRWGRRPMLLIGFAALPIRGLLFAVVTDPYLIVVVQLLDGISAAVLGVLVPLVAADATRGSGRFNLTQGVIGTGMGIGAALSTTLAGYISDSFGSAHAFLALGVIAAASFLLVLTRMPETRPDTV